MNRPLQLFVDTNIFLSFYHYTSDELEEIRKLIILIKKNTVNLYITQQVINEFNRNRENKLNDSLKHINEKFKFGEYPSFCKDFPAYEELETTLKKVKSLQRELLDYTNEKIYKSELEADKVLADLFSSAKTLSISDDIYEKAKRRVVLGNPPGKNSSYGDAINWEIILENSVIFDDLHIIAADKDYYSILDQSKINPFLKKEYENKTIGDISIYRSLSSFFKKNFPKISLETEAFKESIIEKLIDSKNFANTKRYLNVLNNYDDYSSEQVLQFLIACFRNTQIFWIITDPDVKASIWKFYTNHSNELSDIHREQFIDRWQQTFPLEAVDMKIDEDSF